MSVLSVFRSSSSILSIACTEAKCLNIVTRNMSGHGPRSFYITPSRWQWHKFKDMFHFYGMLGIIPLSIFVLGVNIFVGPAQLAEIPEGYLPKTEEYYRHPISRWFAKNIYPTYQQNYEKHLNFVYVENEKRQMRLIAQKIKQLMRERGDSHAYSFRPLLTKYHDRVRKDYENLQHERGT